MKRTCFFFLLFAALFLYPLHGEATRERIPQLARLPILVESSYGLEERVLEDLEVKMDRAVHVPMNGILHTVIYLPEEKCRKALEEVMAELRHKNPKAKLRDAMKPLAERLHADIVVLPVIKNYSQYTYMGFRWDGGSILCSDVRMVLMGYERREEKPIYEEESRFYHSEYSHWGRAEVLAGECMDRMLEKVNLYRMILHANGEPFP